MSLRDKILSQPRRFKDVRIPEWDCTLRVNAMSSKERFEWATVERAQPDADDDNAASRRLIVRCVTDTEGNRVFVDEDSVALESADAAAVGRLSIEASRINGFTAEQVEAVEKKSETRAGNSSPDSDGSVDTSIPTTF